MAESLDVDARLAEGRPAVDTVGEYVWACHLLGYQNPDLTLHAAQVRDWYGSEDGLDLHALEADRAAMAAAAAAADSARQMQEHQLDVLAGAWRGGGGAASQGFLRRHGEASAAAASAARNAADALAKLRDDLWHAVDGKVGAAVTIDDRRLAQRAEWLSASQTVTTGAGDRAAASELIDQQVKPFVDNDIRADWLSAMQKAMAAVSAAFDAATGVLADAARTPFEVPEGLGPIPMPSSPAGTAPAGAVGTTAPAAWPGPATAPPPPAGWLSPAPAGAGPAFPAAPDPPGAPTAAAPTPTTAPAAALPAASAVPSLGDLGGGLPTGGGGLGGLAGIGTRLADAIGGLLDGSGPTLPEASDVNGDAVDAGADGEGHGSDDDNPDEDKRKDDKPNDDKPDDAKPDDAKLDDGDDTDDESDPHATEVADVDGVKDEPHGTCAEGQPVDDAVQAEPAPTAPPMPLPPPIVEPPPNPEPVGAQTPCEIAADELPQAGP